ncbi:winged helix-turn-helix transcriptional regulator [Streptomyces iconiensis]|uniref:winged helix-turn-helix transcriptional regulator n=1 Tax=Streptomyces iconiensis TaxID=1384038 RepID=UPI003D2F88BA
MVLCGSPRPRCRERSPECRGHRPRTPAALPAVTLKSPTACLRRLGRNGMVERAIVSTEPVAIAYRIAALGRTLQRPAVHPGMPRAGIAP